MKNLYITNIFILTTLFLFTGCENPSEYKFQPELVINGQLNAGQPIDSIFVSWSADITERYNQEKQRVSGAEVRINGVLLEEYQYLSGVYYYPDHSYRAQSGESYRIEVITGSKQVSSETTVPSAFQFIPIGVSDNDTVQYVPGTSFFSEAFFTLTWPGYTDSQIFRITSLADIATPENFIADDRPEADVFKGDEEDRVNPAVWWVADDYARINWMFFNYTGWHSLIISAMDDNYYNYRNGILFGEQSGQNFNNIVKGGYGLFASAANDTIRIYIAE